MRLIYLAVPHLSRSERFLTIGSTITTMTVTSGSLQNYLQMNFTRTSLQAFILCQANRLCMMNRFWPDLWSHNNSHVFGISLCPWLWVHFRHGLSISGFPVSGQAVFGSSTYGKPVWWDGASRRWHIFGGLKKCCFLRKKPLLCHFDTLGDKSPVSSF